MIKGLKVKGTFIYDYNNYGYKATRKGFKTYTYGEYTGEYTAADANYPALLQDNRRESERVDMQFQTNYNRTFGNHTIGATYVFERREEKANWMNGERKFDFFINVNWTMHANLTRKYPVPRNTRLIFLISGV